MAAKLNVMSHEFMLYTPHQSSNWRWNNTTIAISAYNCIQWWLYLLHISAALLSQLKLIAWLHFDWSSVRFSQSAVKRSISAGWVTRLRCAINTVTTVYVSFNIFITPKWFNFLFWNYYNAITLKQFIWLIDNSEWVFFWLTCAGSCDSLSNSVDCLLESEYLLKDSSRGLRLSAAERKRSIRAGK